MATFVETFVPGYKAGGPVRSVDALTASPTGRTRYAVITRDRDLGDTAAYPAVPRGRWLDDEGRTVLYVDDRRPGPYLRALVAVRRLRPDVYYVNSLWNRKYTLVPLLLVALGLLPRRPVVIAPRGELLAGARASRPLRKGAALVVLRAVFRVARPVVHCTEPDEAHAVGDLLPGVRTVTVPDTFRLVPRTRTSEPAGSARAVSPPLRVLFVSRIDPKKNLLGALRASTAASAPVHFRVVGPVTDPAYGAICRAAAADSPVVTEFLGDVPHDAVVEHLRWADVFLLPTKGENFGHVIREALAAGVPVLAGRETPWTPLLDAVGLPPLAWDDDAGFSAALDRIATMDPLQFDELRERVLRAYDEWELSQVGVRQDMDTLFAELAAGTASTGIAR